MVTQFEAAFEFCLEGEWSLLFDFGQFPVDAVAASLAVEFTIDQ